MMKLRQATQDDVQIMVEIGRRVHAESRFARFPYDEDKLLENLGALIGLQDKQGKHLCLLVENSEGKLIGCIIGALEEYFFTRSCSASSILFWVDPAYRGSAAALRLIQSFRTWGAKNGASEICIPIASGIHMARTDRFLRRIGFSQTGGNYAAALA
jgi:GNAT superfamily N-acetyltransferase